MTRNTSSGPQFGVARADRTRRDPRWFYLAWLTLAIAIAVALTLLLRGIGASNVGYVSASPTRGAGATTGTGQPATGTKPAVTSQPSAGGASPSPILGIIEGEVVSVDVGRRSVSVRLAAPVARIELIKISPEATIEDQRGHTLSLGELRPGLRLQALGTTIDGQFVARHAVVAMLGVAPNDRRHRAIS